jgi:hypothetical protein
MEHYCLKKREEQDTGTVVAIDEDFVWMHSCGTKLFPDGASTSADSPGTLSAVDGFAFTACFNESLAFDGCFGPSRE